MCDKKNITLGIIGTGRMASARAEACNQIRQAKVQWVCSRSEEKGQKFAEKYNIDKVITDWEQGCQDPEIDSIIITAPNHIHREMAVKALTNNKHVLLEYPMAINENQAQDILKASQKSSGKLHLGLTHRNGGKHFAIKDKLVEVGKIGACNTIICSGNKISRWFDNKEKVGNVIIGSTYHFIDQLLAWFGEVEWVDGDIYEDIETETKNQIIRDVGTVMLGFKDGFTATITYARGYEKPGLGFERKIIGDKGYIVESNDQVEFWSPSGKKEIEVEDRDSVLEDTKMFMDLVQKDSQPEYTPDDGSYGMKIVDACSQAALQGKRVYI